MSKWLWLAIMLRLINGLTNCSLPVTKCVVRETSDITNQAKMFSIREIGFSLGGLIAPVLAAIFSRPADQIWLSGSTVFQSKFFVDFPYALLCYVVSAIDLFCLVIGIFFMKETRRNETSAPSEVELQEITTEGEFDSDDNPLENSDVSSMNEDIINLVTDKEDSSVGSEKGKNCLLRKCNSFTFLDRGTLTGIILYMMLSFVFICVIQIFPVWVTRSEDQHGLEFEEKQIGVILGVGAACSLVYQVFLFSLIDNYFGCVISYRIAAAWFIPLVFLLPSVSYIYQYHNVAVISVGLLISLVIINFSWSIGEVNVMLSNAAPSDAVGRVNGLGNALASLSRLIGPIFATSLFTWTSNLDKGYPLNFVFTFYIVALLACFSFAFTFTVPARVNRCRNTSISGSVQDFSVSHKN